MGEVRRSGAAVDERLFPYFINLLIWNVRGLNHPSKQREVKNMIKLHKIGLVCLIETRVKETKADLIKKMQSFHIGALLLTMRSMSWAEFGFVGINLSLMLVSLICVAILGPL